MTFSAVDFHWMGEALRLARRGLNGADPNPRVGCVLVRDGACVGRGWHAVFGEAHAEAMALTEAGEAARGSTCYVTLEPCSHTGKTGPCAQALVDAGVAEVVFAAIDPHPARGGDGFTTLRQAGIVVRTGLLEHASRALNPGFFARLERGRPWVRLKLAASLDGRLAAAADSGWITGAAARADVQQWRARASVVVTGAGTLRADDPALNLRLTEAVRQPWRIILTRAFDLDPAARTFALEGKVTAVGCSDSPARTALEAAGVETRLLPRSGEGVDLHALLDWLAQEECNELHLECGPTLAGAWLQAGLVDELVLYQAPVLLGDRGLPLARLPGLTGMADGIHFAIADERRFGADRRLILNPRVA